MSDKRGVLDREVPGWVGGALVIGAFAALAYAETRRPLRKRQVEPKLRRDARNLFIAGLAGAAMQLAEKPVTMPLARATRRRHIGLLQQLNLPAWLEVLLGVALLDYTLYLWHVLTHKLHFLWRFHQVHHVDMDMDASTAIRFHVGEMLCSVPWRALQVITIGASPLTLSVWSVFVVVEILFHHSNLELPVWLERWIGKVLVTPRLHGIHHSVLPAEQNSNWSSGLTIWDRLHGTLRDDMLHDEVVVGVPAYQTSADVTLPKVLKMPFGKQRDPWAAPALDAPEKLSMQR